MLNEGLSRVFRVCVFPCCPLEVIVWTAHDRTHYEVKVT